MKTKTKFKNSIIIVFLCGLLVSVMIMTASLAYFTDFGKVSDSQPIAFGVIDLDAVDENNNFVWSRDIEAEDFYPGDSFSIIGGLKSKSVGDFYVVIIPSFTLERKMTNSWVEIGKMYQPVYNPITDSYRAPVLPEEFVEAVTLNYEYRGLKLPGADNYDTENGWTPINEVINDVELLNATDADITTGFYEVGVVRAGNLAHGVENLDSPISLDSGYEHEVYFDCSASMPVTTENFVYVYENGELVPLVLNDIVNRGTEDDREYQFKFSLEFRAIQKKNFFESVGSVNNTCLNLFGADESSGLSNIWTNVSTVAPGTINYRDVYTYLSVRPIMTGEYRVWNTTIQNGASTITCWNFDGTTLTPTVEYKNYINALSVPTKVNIPGYFYYEGKYIPVEKLADSAFYGITNISSVFVGTGLKNLGISAFENCTNLTSIECVSTLQNIGNLCFKGCNNVGLTNITLPLNLKTIGDQAFMNCTKLVTVQLPDTVTSIGSSAFSGCTQLAYINFPDDISFIGSSALTGTTWISNNTDTLYLGKNLYKYVREGEETTFSIREGTETITGYAFYNCSYLTNVTLPSSLITIDKNAFQNCSALTEAIMPAGLKTIGESAYASCSLLHTVTLNEGLEDLETSAFKNCTSLTAIEIPSTLHIIGKTAFSGCSSLSNLIIPNGLTTIRESAFMNCTSLTEITLSKDIILIEKQAFSGCTSLGKVTFNFKVGNTVQFNSNVFAGVKLTTLDFCGIKMYYNSSIQYSNSILPNIIVEGELSYYDLTEISRSYSRTWEIRWE